MATHDDPVSEIPTPVAKKKEVLQRFHPRWFVRHSAFHSGRHDVPGCGSLFCLLQLQLQDGTRACSKDDEAVLRTSKYTATLNYFLEQHLPAYTSAKLAKDANTLG